MSCQIYKKDTEHPQTSLRAGIELLSFESVVLWFHLDPNQNKLVGELELLEPGLYVLKVRTTVHEVDRA